MSINYKVFNVEILPSNHIESIGYILDALNEIKINPDNHGYSEQEVNRIQNIETQSKRRFDLFKKSFDEINHFLKKTHVTINETLGFTIDNIQKLSSFGWFVSPKLIREISIIDLNKLCPNTKPLVIDSQMVVLFGELSKINSVTNSVARNFIHRKQILSEISKAYELGLFSSVIALSYSIADGICNEIWGFGFFDKNKKKDNIHSLKLYLNLADVDFGLSNSFIDQLGITDNEIIMYSKDPSLLVEKNIRCSYNRHLVMHGQSTDYGNQVNALRSILLLEFLNYFVNEKRKIDELEAID